MTITIISVGNKPRSSHEELITTYERRLPHHLNVEWLFIKHGAGDTRTSMLNEAEKILKMLPANTMVVLLDEYGKQLTSEKFSELFIANNKSVTFIIGGAYGVTDEVKNRADYVLSISSFVLPHQLVRLVLAEQIYRGHTIASGHPYHHS